MKKIRLLFSLIIIVPLFALSQSNADTISILDNKAKIVVPAELSKMSDEMFAIKYGNKSRPVLVLSDEEGEINFMADMTRQQALESELSSYKDFRIEQLKKSRSDLEIVEQGVKTVNGKKVAYFKFLSQAVDQKVFNYYFFTLVDGKVLLFVFNCIEKLRKDWEKKADAILLSLKTK